MSLLMKTRRPALRLVQTPAPMTVSLVRPLLHHSLDHLDPFPFVVRTWFADGPKKKTDLNLVSSPFFFHLHKINIRTIEPSVAGSIATTPGECFNLFANFNAIWRVGEEKRN